MKGYYSRLPNCSALEAELWAIYRGLNVAIQGGYNPLHIKTDTEIAVEIIQDWLHQIAPFREMI